MMNIVMMMILKWFETKMKVVLSKLSCALVEHIIPSPTPLTTSSTNSFILQLAFENHYYHGRPNAIIMLTIFYL